VKLRKMTLKFLFCPDKSIIGRTPKIWQLVAIMKKCLYAKNLELKIDLWPLFGSYCTLPLYHVPKIRSRAKAKGSNGHIINICLLSPTLTSIIITPNQGLVIMVCVLNYIEDLWLFLFSAIMIRIVRQH
jgi:hypothetical protein